MLLNAEKCQGYSFSVSELLSENQQGEGEKLPPYTHTHTLTHTHTHTHTLCEKMTICFIVSMKHKHQI